MMMKLMRMKQNLLWTAMMMQLMRMKQNFLRTAMMMQLMRMKQNLRTAILIFIRQRGTRFQSMSKHKIGYNKQSGLVVCKEDGLYCHLCKRYNARNERNGSSVFNQTPCISKCKDVLQRHASSSMHQLALRRQHERLSSDSDVGIRQAFSNSLAAQRRAAIGATKCLYWLAKDSSHNKIRSFDSTSQYLEMHLLDILHRGCICDDWKSVWCIYTIEKAQPINDQCSLYYSYTCAGYCSIFK